MRTPIEVLLIEDDPGDVLLIREWLQASETADYRLEQADRLSAGQKRLKEGRFDVVLVDLGLPDSQGLDTLRRVRAQAPEAAVLVFTGLEDEEVGLQAVEEGAQDYLVKGQVNGPLLNRSVRYALERKRMQDALGVSEERFRMALANSPVVVFNQDKELRYTWVYNPHPGFVAETVLGKTDAELLPAEDAARLGEIKRRVLDTGVAAREEVRTTIGGQASFHDLTVEPLRDVTGNIIGVTCVSVDITERKRAEDAVRGQAEVLQTVFDNVPMMIGFFGPSGRAEYVNRAWEQILGWSLEETRSRDLFVEFYPEEEERARVAAFMREASGEWQDFRTRVRDGRMLETTWTNVRLSDGRTIGIGLDITDRKRAEEALRESEERLKTIFEVLPVGISVLGAETEVVYTNPALPRILDLSQEGLLAGDHGARSYLRPDGTPMPAEEFASARAATERRAVHDVETGVVKEDGEVTWMSVSAAPVAFADWSVVVVTADITERKRAEEALRRSEGRVRELLGHLFRAQEEERERIAGDIHDDSIQVMTAVGLRLDTLRRRLTDPEALESLQPLGEVVTSAISRLRNLMFELRPRVLDEDGLAPALRMYLDHMSEQVQIEYTLANRLEEEPSSTVRTVLYRIAQEALVNIRKHANAARVDVVLEPRGAGYAVRITDDGSGFEVGTTEREPGHLGLAAMRERAEMVGGWWRIESTPGEGTTVEFWVPAEVD